MLPVLQESRSQQNEEVASHHVAGARQRGTGPASGSASRSLRQPASQLTRRRKRSKNPAEYNAYVNAIQQTNPAQKAQALEAFLQTYPNTVMKEDALEQLMVAYQQAGERAEDD